MKDIWVGYASPNEIMKMGMLTQKKNGYANPEMNELWVC